MPKFRRELLEKAWVEFYKRYFGDSQKLYTQNNHHNNVHDRNEEENDEPDWQLGHGKERHGLDDWNPDERSRLMSRFLANQFQAITGEDVDANSQGEPDQAPDQPAYPRRRTLFHVLNPFVDVWYLERRRRAEPDEVARVWQWEIGRETGSAHQRSPAQERSDSPADAVTSPVNGRTCRGGPVPSRCSPGWWRS